MCDCNGKQTEMWWEIVFHIKHGGMYSKHWDLKGFTLSIYITEGLILLDSISPVHI